MWMKLFCALAVLALVVAETTTTDDKTEKKDADGKPLRIDPILRKALLRALNNIKDKSESETEDNTASEQSTEASNEADSTTEFIEESTLVDKLTSIDYHTFVDSDSQGDKSDDNEIIRTIIVTRPKTTQATTESDEVQIVFTTPATNLPAVVPPTVEPVKIEARIVNKAIEVDEITKGKKKATEKVTKAPVAVITPPPPPEKTHNDDGENIEKVNQEDVKIFQAPLVAAFTVHQDALGLPRNVIPIGLVPIPTGAPLIPVTPMGKPIISLNTQRVLEEKNRQLEAQLINLQNQQRQQEQIYKQKLIQEQQTLEQQQQILVQQRARFEEENRMRFQKLQEEQRIFRVQQEDLQKQQQVRAQQLELQLKAQQEQQAKLQQELQFRLQQEQLLRKQQEELLKKQLEEEQLIKQQKEELLRRQQQEELLRRQQQEEQLKRKQQEEIIRRQQEEQFKRKQQEEQLKKKQQQEELLKKQQEDQQLKKKQYEEFLKNQQEEQLKRKQQEELLKKQQEEQLKKKQEEFLKRQQEEQQLKKKQYEEFIKNQQEEQLKRKQQEELFRKQQEEQFKKKQEDFLKRQQEEQLKRKQYADFLQNQQEEQIKKKRHEEGQFKKQQDELKAQQFIQELPRSGPAVQFIQSVSLPQKSFGVSVQQQLPFKEAAEFQIRPRFNFPAVETIRAIPVQPLLPQPLPQFLPHFANTPPPPQLSKTQLLPLKPFQGFNPNSIPQTSQTPQPTTPTPITSAPQPPALPIFDQQLPSPNRVRVFRQEQQVGNFGLNTNGFQPIVPIQSIQPDEQLENLLVKSGIVTRAADEFRVIAKVLALNHGIPQSSSNAMFARLGLQNFTPGRQ